MAFKAKDRIWAACSQHMMNLEGRLPATIVSKVGLIGRYFWKLEGDYFITIVGRPCPSRRNGVPPGAWIAWSTELSPRVESDEEAATIVARSQVSDAAVQFARTAKRVIPPRGVIDRSWGVA